MSTLNDQQQSFGLAVAGLTVARDEKMILRDIDLVIEPRSVTILRGANGAGKTTLLRSIAGLITVDKKAISVNNAGTPIDTGDHRAHVLYCGHVNGVSKTLSVAENLHYWADLYDQPRHTVLSAAKTFALTEMMERRASVLSAGQQRRLSLCRALIADKPIWLLDEPTASMDDASQELFCEVICGHRDAGGAALIATHEPLPISGARSVILSRVA